MYGNAIFSTIMCNNNNGSLTAHKIGKCFKPKFALKNSEIQTKSRFLPLPMKMVHVMGFVALLRQLLARISFSCNDIMTTQQLCTGTIQYIKCTFYAVPSVMDKKKMKLVPPLHIETSVTWICFSHGLPMFLSVAEKLTSFFCNR
jgi:hypothetical protein